MSTKTEEASGASTASDLDRWLRAVAKFVRADTGAELATIVRERPPSVDVALTTVYETLRQLWKQSAAARKTTSELGAVTGKRLDALDARLAALEVRPRGLEFCGTWQRANLYNRHQGVVHGGSLFVCTADATRGEIPGSSNSWTLCAKSGRDGRDGHRTSASDSHRE